MFHNILYTYYNFEKYLESCIFSLLIMFLSVTLIMLGDEAPRVYTKINKTRISHSPAMMTTPREKYKQKYYTRPFVCYSCRWSSHS